MSQIYNFLRKLISSKSESGQYSSGAWPAMVRRETLKLLTHKESGELLDAGCGEGLFTIALAKALPQFKIIGADCSNDRLDQSRIKVKKDNITNIDFINYDITQPKDDCIEKFDYAVCINTLFNFKSLSDVRQALINITKNIKPGGSLIFDFRNSANILVNIKYAIAPLYDKTIAAQNISLKTYSLSEIKKIIDLTGLKTINIKPLGLLKNYFAPIILIEAKKC
jgi:ubiquinone/menaquinone biosynthesis C-methylase UbiE